ncbi:DNA replication licensing factor mcm2 [Zancudomyces culisetae]|nr:DNA replication licensing factor mcm2 [Zancudomyces culisetae]|eukprot:OMH81415.1 DNA replication licensing factor mcm2 [Zancudomyces culisetae]
MYARENITPKIHQVDSDKISHLYAELRRESLMTGSIPITVRHIESIVRLSEARARMHLRDFVRADDIDVAIRVTLNSFISAQKFSVYKALKRSFSKYLSSHSDHNELLYMLLCRLVQDKVTLYQYKNGISAFPAQVNIPLEDLENLAAASHIYDLKNFLTSNFLSSHDFTVDLAERAIYKHFQNN